MKLLGETAIAVLAPILAMLAAPALADVKAGVDAWAKGDYRKAVDEWRGPAVAGDADAQFNLGQAYKLGRGVPIDLGMAEEWYRKSALQGHPQAEDNYGLALFQNNKRDQALPWLEKSAGRGEPRAQFVLGTMLFNGDAVQRDWVRAYALMTRASSAGLPQATSTLAQMDRYIGLKERQQGTELARKYEAQVGTVQVANDYPTTGARPTPPIRTAALPPSRADVATTAPKPRPTPKPPTPKPTPVAERPTATTQPVAVAAKPPTPKPATDGGWRVQLGAFKDVGNARGLYTKLSRGPLAGKQQYLVKAGAITRLLVGPYASQSDAAKACGAVKPNPCVPTRG